MKKIFYISAFLLAVFTILLFSLKINKDEKIPSTSETINTTPTAKPSNDASFASPIDNALSRITKKPFGIYVSPGHSPVSPERFTGYHTGVDFETTKQEQNVDVQVYAICQGELIQKKIARGYGGMAVEKCALDGQTVTVVYGHIRLSSVSLMIGEKITQGQFLANLGKRYSTETDGERKHLHLGIHKGASPDTRGYVASKSELSGWIDVEQYLK